VGGFRWGKGVREDGGADKHMSNNQPSNVCTGHCSLFRIRSTNSRVYDVINVRTERCEGSLVRDAADVPFYMCVFDGTLGRER